MKGLDIEAEFRKIYPLSMLSYDELVQHAISNTGISGPIPEWAIKRIDMTAEEIIRQNRMVSIEDVIKTIESKLR